MAVGFNQARQNQPIPDFYDSLAVFRPDGCPFSLPDLLYPAVFGPDIAVRNILSRHSLNQSADNIHTDPSALF